MLNLEKDIEDVGNNFDFKSKIVAEVSVVSEKFPTFPFEGISMIWMKESSINKIRGVKKN